MPLFLVLHTVLLGWSLGWDYCVQHWQHLCVGKNKTNQLFIKKATLISTIHICNDVTYAIDKPVMCVILTSKTIYNSAKKYSTLVVVQAPASAHSQFLMTLVVRRALPIAEWTHKNLNTLTKNQSSQAQSKVRFSKKVPGNEQVARLIFIILKLQRKQLEHFNEQDLHEGLSVAEAIPKILQDAELNVTIILQAATNPLTQEKKKGHQQFPTLIFLSQPQEDT